jgi:hypothetical protein
MLLLLKMMRIPVSFRRTIGRFVTETVAVKAFDSSTTPAAATATGATIFYHRTVSLEMANFPALFTRFSLRIKRMRQNARAEEKN